MFNPFVFHRAGARQPTTRCQSRPAPRTSPACLMFINLSESVRPLGPCYTSTEQQTY